ncbi:MAG: zinc ribbon domain-containing protein [Bacillota bacterium]|nr:zinc ribbon domain-containing protein [Bacillota bacterium]
MDFDTIKEKLNKAANYTVRKSGEVVNVAKLKIKETELESRLENLFTAIGRAMYTEHQEETDSSVEISGILEEIDKLKSELYECKEEINKLTKMNTCPGCGKTVSDEAKYCSECGTNMKTE